MLGATTSASSPSSGGVTPDTIDLGAILPEGWEERSGPLGKAASAMLHNPYFSAGAGLWVLTVGGMMGRASYSTVSTLLRRRFLVSMEVTNTDSSFEWLLKWMSQQKSFKVQQMTVLTSRNYSHSNDNVASKLFFGPCAGVQHYFFYQGRPITLYRLRTDKKDYDGDVFETLKLSTIGLSTKIFEDIIYDAKRLSETESLNRTVVYVNSGGRWTRQQTPRARRPFDSVVMPGTVADQLAEDVRSFLRSGDYYRNLGVPYRRGYLLHGPPGCGKTSFVMALAGELNLSISLLSLANRSVNDEALMELLNSANQSSVVLIEDIDRAFSSESAVSMSGLLNALDGVGAQEGNVVFMTTNHVERLDAALIRPGRADVKVEIGLLDQAQTRKLFHKFYPDAPQSLQDEFASLVPPNTVSPAQIQSHLFFHRDDPGRAVSSIGDFLASARSFEKTLEDRRRAAAKSQEMVRPPIL